MFKKPQREVERVFLHCSASNRAVHDDVSVITDWHRQRWPDLCATQPGYHFFITSKGVVQPGRDLELKPVAQANHNSHTIAICLHGLNADDFTEAQFDALRDLCKQINEAYGGAVTFHGHKEVSIKACPVFDYKAVLSLDSLGRLGGADGAVTAPALPTLKQGSKGGAVAHLQRLLGVAADGQFGPATHKAVVAFQQAEGLTPDGIVGPATWKAISNLKGGV